MGKEGGGTNKEDMAGKLVVPTGRLVSYIAFGRVILFADYHFIEMNI